MAYQGIIFDFNGVLWWDSHLQERAWREFGKQQFGVLLTDEIMAVEVHGRNNRHTLEFLAGGPLDQQQVAQLSNRKEMHYRELCLAEGDGFRLSPGAVDLLDALKAKEVPRTIATASGIDNLMFFIEHLQLERWFDPTVIVYDDGIGPGKPAPDIYLRAAHRIGLKPGECVVVEDSMAGIQAARTACIGYIIALVHDGRNLSERIRRSADQYIQNLSHISWNDNFQDRKPD